MPSITANVIKYSVSLTANVKRGAHKEEIKHQYASNCGRDRRPAAHPRGYKRNAGQKDHHDVSIGQICRPGAPTDSSAQIATTAAALK